MVKIVNCDIFEDNSDAILHCANCFNTLGAGFAREITKRYPEARLVDSRSIKGDKNKLGTFTRAQGGDGKWIYNLYGQYEYGGRGRNLNYEAFYASLQYAYNSMTIDNLKSASAPFGIGSGLAGGDWNIVFAMLNSVFGTGAIDLTICKL